MSCNRIYFKDGEKRISPVLSETQYRALRDVSRNVEMAQLARQGDEKAKRQLQQFSYNVVGQEGQLPKETCMLGGTFFYDYDDPETREDFIQTCMERREEIGLCLLERSTHGAHAVLKRKPGTTILENQYRISQLLGVEWDNESKDPQRIVFSGPSSDIVYLSPDLFDYAYDETAARQEYQDLKERERQGREEVPEWAKKRGKHTNSPSPDLPRGGGDENSDSDANANLNLNSNENSNENSNPNADQTLPLEGEGRERVSGVGGLDYSRIIPAFFQLENSSYPDIVEGVRNDTIFGVCAKYLRYCCDHNAAKMKALLFPQYSFGLSEEEVNSIIRSALARERGLTPKVVKKVLAASVSNSEEEDNTYQEGVRVINEMYGMEDPTDDEPAGWMGLSGMYPSVANCIVEDMMMPKLPRFVETLLKVCPPGHKFVTLGCASPAVMTLLTGITCQFGSKRPSRLNGWAHLDGLPAAGKESIVAPIKLLLTPIKEQDDRNREAINEAIRQRDIKRNQETVDPIPELPMRILPPNTTRNGHIDNMVKAKGAHTYTLATELQSLNTHGAGYYDREDFERLLFENGEVGTVTKMDTSQKQMTPCCWNVTTSSTRDQTVAHWKNVTNGAVTRVMFLLMPDTTFTEMPQYVQYTPEDRAYVVRAARIMTEMKGLVETPRLSRAMAAWLHDVLEEARQEKNTIRGILRKRSADIAFYFGVVIHLCWAVQQVMDEEDALERKGEKLRRQLQEAQQQNDSERLAQVENALIALQQERATWQATRLDLSRFSEHKASADLAVYAANYTLNTQYDLFGRKMKQQLTSSYEGVQKVTERQDCRLSRLPKTPFTVEQLIDVFPEMNNGSIRKMIARWLGAQLVVKVGTKDRIAQYALKLESDF